MESRRQKLRFDRVLKKQSKYSTTNSELAKICDHLNENTLYYQTIFHNPEELSACAEMMLLISNGGRLIKAASTF